VKPVTYPNITVKLSGEDGNAFNIIGVVSRGMRTGDVPLKEVKLWKKEAMHRGSYDELLQFCMNTVNIV